MLGSVLKEVARARSGLGWSLPWLSTSYTCIMHAA